MKAMHAVSHQDVLWIRAQWWRRHFDLRARGELPERFSQEQNTGKSRSGALGAILGAMALSFFGMRCWVFMDRWLSSGTPAQATDLPSSSQDSTSKDFRVQESLSVASLKQSMEV